MRPEGGRTGGGPNGAGVRAPAGTAADAGNAAAEDAPEIESLLQEMSLKTNPNILISLTLTINPKRKYISYSKLQSIIQLFSALYFFIAAIA